MYQFKELFTGSEKKEVYAPASSFIKNGSVLDRRKFEKDRRISLDRRESSLTSSQHEKKLQPLKQDLGLNFVKILEEEYRKMLSLMNQLIISAELESFAKLPAHIVSFDKKVKSNLHMEEDMLYLFVDSLSHKSFKEKDEIHTLLDKFIYNASQEVISLIAPYIKKTVTETNVKIFLSDVNKVGKLLADNHKHKEEYLYKMYTKVTFNK